MRTYEDVSGTEMIALLAKVARRETFREARFFGITPLVAALFRFEVAALSVTLMALGSFSAIAVFTFLIVVLTAELTARFLSRRFCDCRSLFNADG